MTCLEQSSGRDGRAQAQTQFDLNMALFLWPGLLKVIQFRFAIENKNPNEMLKTLANWISISLSVWASNAALCSRGS